MHSIRHWTPHYLWNRMKEKAYCRQHPGDPWLAPEAVNFLGSFLKSTDKGLEFGSGRSTLWFAQRVNALTSVEHNPKWYAIVSEQLKIRQAANVAYFLHPKNDADTNGATSDYVNVTESIPQGSLDFVLIDGTYRAQCTLHSIPLLKPGGMLIIDNVNKYLPSASVAPNSRSFTDGAIDAEWETVLEMIGSWRYFWTGNGVSDTAIYFKPVS